MRNIILLGDGTPQWAVWALFTAYGIYSALTEGVERALTGTHRRSRSCSVAMLFIGAAWTLPPAFRTFLCASGVVVYQKS